MTALDTPATGFATITRFVTHAAEATTKSLSGYSANIRVGDLLCWLGLGWLNQVHAHLHLFFSSILNTIRRLDLASPV